MILDYINNQQCCGCGACKEICLHGAIRMGEDSEGFLQPLLVADLCTNCGACDKVCPIKNAGKTKKEVRQSFAAINKSQKILNKSSSGGIFSSDC